MKTTTTKIYKVLGRSVFFDVYEVKRKKDEVLRFPQLRLSKKKGRSMSNLTKGKTLYNKYLHLPNT